LATRVVALPAPRAAHGGRAVVQGLTTLYLSLVVLLPLAALLWRSRAAGGHGFWTAISSSQAVAAIELTLTASLIVAAVNAIAGTALASATGSRARAS
jgi:sulfate transport system permease protein